MGEIGTVTAVWEENGMPMARVETGDASRAVCALYVPDVARGAAVHVHLGFVTEILDAERAADALALRALASEKEENS